MIAVRLEGRLGNQLFQYAFIFSAAKELDTIFYVDQYTDESIIHKYFNIRLSLFDVLSNQLFHIRGYKNLFSFHLKRPVYKSIKTAFNLKVINCPAPINSGDVPIRNNSMYHGFFQSELFFIKSAGEIRKLFSVKKKWQFAFHNKYDHLYNDNKAIVAVHIRRTDYLHLQHLNLGGEDLSLPLEYYIKAILKYDNGLVHFVFLTDDPDFVEENFQTITNKTISNDSEIIDFQHLLNADGCIISNSTFSWWGAWLNNKPNKVVYAPKYFMGWRVKQEYPENIYPEGWNIIEI